MRFIKHIIVVALLLTIGVSFGQTYHIGDLYTAPDGSQGIVYYIHPDGSGGWVVALEDVATSCAWGGDLDIPDITNISYDYSAMMADTAGYHHTAILRSVQNGANYAANIVDFQAGWYLPTAAQLAILFGVIPEISGAIALAGGTSLVNDFYWSCSEYNAGSAWSLDFGYNENSGGINSRAKYQPSHVRAIRSFTYETDPQWNYLWSTGATTPDISVTPTQTITYTVTVSTSSGCADTVEHTIVVNSVSSETSFEAFDCNSYYWNGELFTESGTYMRTLTNAAGCDSVVTLHLTVNHGTHNVETETACESYTWHGETYTVTGTYTYAYTNGDGCPSVDTLHLTVNHGTHNVETETACENYTWHGETYTTTGTYTYSYTNADGCPSVDTLHLTVNYVSDSTINVSVMEDALPYILNGESYDTSGTYYQTLTNASGCDSMLTIVLSVITTFLPDNVDSANCVFFPDGTAWGIRTAWQSENIVSVLNTPLVGDLDGDGVPEIVCFARDGDNSTGDPRCNNHLLVFDGRSKAIKASIILPSYVSGFDAAAYGLVRLPNGPGLIVVACFDYKLRAYDISAANPSVPYWVSDIDFGESGHDWAVNVSFADFNHDGHPEVFVRNKVYNAETGVLLAAANTNTHYGASYAHWTNTGAHPYKLSSPIAADVCGDVKLDLILGNEVYDVNINNLAGTLGNSITLAQRVTPPGDAPEDGHPQVADFNHDGYLDVFVSVRNTYESVGYVYGYVWDIHNQTVSAPFVIRTGWSGKSIPLIADIDNDNLMEVLIQSEVSWDPNKFQAYKYHPDTKTFTLEWGFPTDENSYSNSITAFDFNQDGLLELMISDQNTMRIVNGSGISHITHADTIPMYVLNSFPFSQNTIMQYPVIADVDADGSAEIVSVGSDRLNILKSSTSVPWAPARKVWNQYMYNVTNVNEDLTIPQYLFNNAMTFTDPEGVVRRPFNNFLQQATTIDQYGRPFYAVPDVAVNQTVSLQANDDSLLLSFSYCNFGDNTLNAPYPVTVFANTYGGDTVCTVTIGEGLPVDSCTRFDIHLPITSLCAFPNIDSLIVAVNCAGAGIAQNGNLQPECDTTNNTATVSISLHPDTTYLTETACNSYLWYGDTLVLSGEYTHVLTNAAGCDSVVTLHLTIIPPPTLSHTLDTTIIAGTSADLWASGADVLYWTDGSGNILASGPSLTVNPTSPVTYYITGQNQGDCSAIDSVYVHVTGYPDNVDSADCVFFPEGTEWGIDQPLISSAAAITVTTPMVGDIDDDGQQEIVIPAGNYTVSSTINIFNADVTLKSQIHTVNFYIWNSVGLAKVKWQENEYKNIIVILGTDKRLYAYDAQGTQLWQSNATFGTQYNESTPLPSVSFADFNHDGWTEIYIGAEIYDAATGVLLSKASGNKGFSGRTWSTQNNVYHTVAADFCGNYDLELAAGNTIYSVDIQSRTDFNANQMTVVKEVPSIAMKMEDNSSIPFTDGNTYLVDLNLDGRLDVLVMNVDQSHRVVYLYVWDVETQSVICSKKISNARKFGTPQIGDINQDGYDEICFITGTYSEHSTGNNDLIYALGYNPQNSNGELDVLWTTSHSDNSACTGLTLFDFNQDGIAELVYRDRFNLRIINGSLIHHQTGEALTQPYDMAVSPCGSATGIEYPLVVDVDLDGEAEIVVGGATYETDFGHLYIFNSSGEPWAPARKVWNQYMYNVTNVNEDLTIPQYLFNNAMTFTDPEGVVRRPFNNFLQQATTIDQYGRPFYAVPDVAVNQTVSLQANGDSLLLSFSYCNFGDNTLNAPYPVTVFANTYGGDTVCTVTIGEGLPVDSCTRFDIHLPITSLCAFPNIDSLIVAVNCAGAGIAQNGNLQPECDTTNNTATVSISLHPDTTHLTETACDHYLWYGETLVLSGEYSHVLTNAAGCDSVVTLHLTINHSNTGDTTATVCDSFDWYEQTNLTASGDYTRTVTNVAGCDSVVTLHLTVNHSNTGDTTATVCDSFDWYGQTNLTVSGDYTRTVTNAAGCDSVVTLHLTINHSNTGDTSATVCDSFDWYEQTNLTVSGDYTRTVTNAAGCDSVVTLHLTINHSNTGDTSATVCDSFDWYGQTNLSASGDYTRTVTNVAGCDSVVTLHLTINHSNTGDTSATACDSFDWYEQTNLTTSGDYTRTVTNVAGCDSVVTLHLTINHSNAGDTSAIACDSFDWYEQTNLTVSGDYTRTVTNAAGCDSVVTLHLTVNHSNTGDTSATVCNSYLWYGDTLVLSGEYTHVLTNAAGCDSVVTLHLTVNYSAETEESLTLLENNLPYTYGDTVFDVGIPEYSVLNFQFSTYEGCDSMVTLYLTVLYNVTTHEDTTVCETELPLTWNGVVFSAEEHPGVYAIKDSVILTSPTGVDSTVVMTVHVRPLPAVTINGSPYLCGDSSVILSSDSAFSYLWNTGETTQSVVIFEEGYYTLSVTDEYGCTNQADKRVYSSENPITSIDIPDMCFGGSYTISVGHNPENNIQLGSGETTLSVSDSVFLPDGVPCAPYGCSYRSPLTFTAYGNNEVVESVEDIYYVRINIEHSWVGDIYINITCPNGQKADILKYGGSGNSDCNSSILPASRGWQACPGCNNVNVGSYFGEAADYEGYDYCDSNSPGNEQGIGWNYCWSNNTSQNYTYAPGAGSLIYREENVHYNILDSSDVYAGTHFYHPDESFSGLIGCPLNGSWYIEVIDGWNVDNGYIFEWELALRNEVADQVAEFTNATTEGPWISSISDSLFIINPPADITHDTTVSYTFQIFDSYGCHYDTTVSIHFIAPAYTYIDTAVCGAFEWDGIVYTESGQYSRTLISTEGCDSIITLNLTVNTPVHQSLTVTECDSYTWLSGDGQIYTLSGDYTYVHTDTNNCTQVDTLHLTIYHGTVSYDTLVLAENQLPYHFTPADTVIPSGSPTEFQFAYHLATIHGCDSTIMQTVLIHHNTSETHDTTVCAASLPCTWHGHVFTQAGSYVDTLTHADGSVNVVTYQLAVSNPTVNIQNVSHIICYGESTGGVAVLVNGGTQPYTCHWENASGATVSSNAQLTNQPAGNYVFYATDAIGCQTTVTVTLNHLNNSMAPGVIADDQAVCEGAHPAVFTGTAASGGAGSAYQWQISTDGNTWTAAPTPNNAQNYTYPNAVTTALSLRRAWVSTECGTVYSNVINVTLKPTYADTITDIVCQGHPYQENGFNLTAEETAGTAMLVRAINLQSVLGCDSVVTLMLSIRPAGHSDAYLVLCADELPYTYGDTVFGVGTPAHSVVNMKYSTPDGCDSVLTLHLTINPVYDRIVNDMVCEGAGYALNGFHITPLQTVGVAEVEQTLNLQSHAGCDSTVTLHLAVMDTSIAIVSLTDDFCEEYSAELSVVTNATSYMWSTGETDQTITVSQPGLYTVTAMQSECSMSAWYKIEVCEFNIYLPNAITPGLNDGMNDYFCIHDQYKPMIEEFEIRIFTRWGERVYYSNNKDFKWNGEHNGRILRNIIYTYIINIVDKRGVPYQLTGTITVL